MNNRMAIDTFLSYFTQGVSRPNRFRVECVLPRGISADALRVGGNQESVAGSIMGMERYFNQGGAVNIKCHTATFPQRNLMVQEIRQNSAPFRAPYSASYDPITFSFYANGNLDTRDYFEVWQSAVVNLGTNTMNFYDEYTSDMSLVMMNEYGHDTYSVKLYEAWPLNVGLIDVSYSQQNALTNVVVTMSYKSWAPIHNLQDGKASASTT